ncbi:hypothetical protein D3C81_1814980 [compost metagenome]
MRISTIARAICIGVRVSNAAMELSSAVAVPQNGAANCGAQLRTHVAALSMPGIAPGSPPLASQRECSDWVSSIQAAGKVGQHRACATTDSPTSVVTCAEPKNAIRDGWGGCPVADRIERVERGVEVRVIAMLDTVQCCRQRRRYSDFIFKL